ncbi:hypothetical protein AgCh_029091 [Apium graveolens]
MNRTRITFSRKVFQILSAPIRVLSVHSNAKYSSYNRNKNSRCSNPARLNNIRTYPYSNKIYIFPEAKGLTVTAYLRSFSLAELTSATRGFSPDMLLGAGKHGWVFIGWLDEDTFAPSNTGIGMAVSIKRFNPNEKSRAMQIMGNHFPGLFGSKY